MHKPLCKSLHAKAYEGKYLSPHAKAYEGKYLSQYIPLTNQQELL